MGQVVTIDGPAGAGKSTVARKLAERLGWHFLDTGAMYRAVTLAAIRAGIDLGDEPSRARLVGEVCVELTPDSVRLDGVDVSAAIRSLEVTRATGTLADSPSVRASLREWQRTFARDRNVVTEGRDQGTVVFPDAFRKFFLTASDEERALRRLDDYRAQGHTEAGDLDSVLREIQDRDARDTARVIAPMRPAADAIVIDSTGLGVEDVVEVMMEAIRRADAKVPTEART